jgi:tripartite-type tricarboxylate transporter receptor subunit TctC
MSGVYAPTGTPREIVARLNREIARIMQTPETRAMLASMQAEAVVPMSPQEFAAHQQRARPLRRARARRQYPRQLSISL